MGGLDRSRRKFTAAGRFCHPKGCSLSTYIRYQTVRVRSSSGPAARRNASRAAGTSAARPGEVVDRDVEHQGRVVAVRADIDRVVVAEHPRADVERRDRLAVGVRVESAAGIGQVERRAQRAVTGDLHARLPDRAHGGRGVRCRRDAELGGRGVHIPSVRPRRASGQPPQSAAAALLVAARKAVPRRLRPDHRCGAPRTRGIVAALSRDRARRPRRRRGVGHPATLARRVDVAARMAFTGSVHGVHGAAGGAEYARRAMNRGIGDRSRTPRLCTWEAESFPSSVTAGRRLPTRGARPAWSPTATSARPDLPERARVPARLAAGWLPARSTARSAGHAGGAAPPFWSCWG